MMNRKIRINMSDYAERKYTQNGNIRINMSDYAEQKDTH